MTDETRPSASTLKGRLADVYVPALVSGSLDALSKRLGNRATVDDPLYGRASSLASLEPLVGKVSSWFVKERTTYRHVASTTGVDRDVSEGILHMAASGREMPIAVVAERRRLREIELRVFYVPPDAAGRSPRGALVTFGYGQSAPLAPLVVGLVDAFRTGSPEAALASFEEGGRLVDARGGVFEKRSGALATHLDRVGSIDITVTGSADDGRTCCLEGSMSKKGGTREPSSALLSLERGDSGLVHEARFYWE